MLWNNLSFNVLCSGGGCKLSACSKKYVLTSFFNLTSFTPYCPCDVNVMNQGKTIFYFGFVFENDQLSQVTLTCDFYAIQATGTFKTWPFCQRLNTIF